MDIDIGLVLVLPDISVDVIKEVNLILQPKWYVCQELIMPNIHHQCMISSMPAIRNYLCPSPEHSLTVCH